MGWPCWMGGDCEAAAANAFNTPEDKQAAVAKWKQSSGAQPKVEAGVLKEEKEAAIARWKQSEGTKAQDSGSLGCALGMKEDCTLPTEADKSRWRREREQDRISRHNSEVGEEGHMDREIAKRNGLPVPKQGSDISEKGASEVVSETALQKGIRKDLMRAAMDRVKALSTQVHAIKKQGRGKDVKSADLHAAGGNGLLSQGPNKAKVLAKFPNSQTKIVGIIHQVKTAQEAKEAAAAAQAKAEH